MRRNLLAPIIWVLVLHSVAEAAASKDVVIQPGPSDGKDTWIGSLVPLRNSGASDTLLIGKADALTIPIVIDEPLKTMALSDWRGLLQFDFSKLPSDASNLEARLYLYVDTYWQGTGGATKLATYRLTAPWTEGAGTPGGGADWLHRNPGTLWTAQGGDFVWEVGEKRLERTRVWLDWDIKQMAEFWAARPDSNFGLLVKRKRDGYALGSFVSSDDPDPALRPKVALSYQSDVVDDLPALLGGAAEIQPSVVPKSSTVELALYANLGVNSTYFGMGADYLTIKMPTNFREPTILGVTHDGAPIAYTDASDGGNLKLELGSRLERDGVLVVRFTVQTPATPDPSGKPFYPLVDDRDTQEPADTVSEGDANALPGDGDTYVIRVSAGPLARIDVSPANPVVTTDSTLLFTATGFDAAGYPVPITPVWSVTGGIGTISGAGLFDPTTVRAGFVLATAQGITGSTSVSVTHGRAAALTVSPADTTLILGGTARFSATAVDADGNAFVPEVTWWATASIGTIDGAGLFVSRGRGNGIVRGTADGASDSSGVTVRYGALVSIEIDPPTAAVTTDTLLAFQADVRDEAGNDVDTTVTWGVDGGIGTIDASGVFDARRLGSGSVTASIGTLAASAPVAVSFGRPARLAITPRDSTISAIESLSFTAHVEDADSNSFVTTAVLWAEPTGTGTIDPSGLFHAFTAGAARIAASGAGLTDTTALTVLPGPLAALQVLPRTDTIDTETTIDFEAVATDIRGNVIPDPGPLLWSGGSSIGGIDPATGLFTPTTVGTDSVAVTRGTVTGRSGRIAVVAGPTRSVVLDPASLEIVVGSDSLFSAVARDIAGNPTGVPVLWSVTGGVGTISGGRFTASSPGTGAVIASASSVRDTAAVTVFNNAGIRIDAVLENRSTVSRGEQGIEIRLVITNRTGDALTGLSGALRFYIGNIDVSPEYAVTAIPFTHEPLPDGASDTLRLLVSVSESATLGSTVVLDGRAAGTLQSSDAAAAGLTALRKGEWTVGDSPQLVDVSRSLYPNKACAGNRVGFAITLRNTGPVSVTADEATSLSFSDGSATYQAPLSQPVTFPPGGGSGALLFDASVIPGAFDPGRYTVTLAVRGIDGNGSAFSQDLQASGSSFELLPPYVLVSAEPIDSRIVHPGADSISLLRLTLTNLYEQPATLSQMRVTNGNSGPGTTAEKDGEWDLVRLVDDRNRDGRWNAGDALLGSGTFSQGARSFAVTLTIAPGDTAGLLVVGDLSLTRARDGEGLNAWIASAPDVVFGAGIQVEASFPLDSPGAQFVDGFVVAQMSAFSSFPTPLPAGAADSLALDMRVPSNGYLADTLRTITVQNVGTAAAGTDLSELRLWRDGGNGSYDHGVGDDTDLGELYWTGAGWTRSGINLAVPVGGWRLFVTLDASESPTDQRTVRLRVPIDGVSMASGNDGPMDDALLSPVSRIIGGARRIIVELSGSESGPVRPGEMSRPLVEFSIANLYPDSVHLEGLTITNRSSGAAADSVARSVRLYAGALIGIPGPYGNPIAVAPSREGVVDLNGFTFSVPPGGTRSLTAAVDVALQCVSDGDSILLALAAPSDLRFRTTRSVTGAFPLLPPSPPVVDGLVAAQVTIGSFSSGVLAPTESGRLALEITIPSNGCLPDTLEGVRVQNTGSASAGEIERLTLHTSDDPETSLGSLVWNGQVWVREGISLPIPPGGALVRVRVTPAADAEDGHTLRLAVPVNGLSLASSNDGPSDASLVSPAVLTISTSPLFASLEVSARTVSVGQAFATYMTVSNTDQGGTSDTLAGVRPDSLVSYGAALTLLASPPADTAVRLAPGGEARFAWLWRAETAGTARFVGSASGTPASGGLSIGSPSAESDELEVQDIPSGINVSPEPVLQGPFNRGDRNLRLWVLTLAHGDPAGSGAAEIRVDTIRAGFRNDAGTAIPPNTLLRGAVAKLGGSVIGIVDSASVGEPLLEIPVAPPLRIAPGGTQTVTVLIDLLEETSVASFRGVIEGTSVLAARDANSLEPVGVTGPLPSETGTASIVVPPTNLTVTVLAGLPARVNRGTESVSILTFRLQTSGTPGVTSKIAIRALQVFLTDGSFPFESARVSGPQGTHFTGSGWSRSGSILSFPLDPGIEVSVNNPIQVQIAGRVQPSAPLGLFRLGLDDTLFVHPETQNEGPEIEVVLLLTETIESIVVVPTDSIHALGVSSADTSVAHPGDRSREVFRLLFVHPGADTLSPVRVDGFRTRLEDGAGDSVEARSVIAQTRVYREGILIASLAPLSEGAATLAIPFTAAPVLEPGDSAEVFVQVDLRADAPPNDYRFAVPAEGIDARDGIVESPVPVRLLGSDASLFRSEAVHVRRMSDRVDVFVDLRLPPVAVGGASVERAARVRFAPSGGENAAALRVASLAIVVEGADETSVDPAGVFASASIVEEGGENPVSASFGEDKIVFAFDPPLVLSPADTLSLAADLTIAESPAESSFRIRLPLEEVRVAEGNPAVRRAESDTGANPSGYAHLAEKTFSGSLRNYPNPFASGREETTISFYARARGRVVVQVFTGLGVPVRRWEAPVGDPGLVETKWDGRNGDGRDVLSGVYLASIDVLYDDGNRDHGIHKIAVLR